MEHVIPAHLYYEYERSEIDTFRVGRLWWKVDAYPIFTWIVASRPRDAAITATSIVAHISGSTIDLKLSPCM